MRAQTETLPAIFSICGISPDAAYVVMHDGVAAIDRQAKPVIGKVLLIRFCGTLYYARFCGEAFITEDGEAIEGDALEEVEYLGVVTHRISPASLEDGIV